MSSKCYYDVLDVSRSSTFEEIRASYKRKALQLHPDKNTHRLEEATREFAYLQQCYSILSDTNERKWYDLHREQILNASSKEASLDRHFLNIDDLMPYFSPNSIFKGYSDDSSGFFTVYRNLFQQIEFYENQLLKNLQKPPEKYVTTTFGNSTTSYIPTLKLFYDKWIHFNTQKSFTEFSKYKTSENREYRRHIEREEKKEQECRKKEYITTVRSLVLFVRKRDPRYQKWLKAEQEKKLTQATLKAKNNKAEGSQCRKNSNMDTNYWKNEEEKEAYEEYFSMYVEEYASDTNGEGSISDNKHQEDEEEIHQCIACNKIFKSESQWINHEASKKHQKNLFQLKKKILKEEDKWQSYLKESKKNPSSEYEDDLDVSSKFEDHVNEKDTDNESDEEGFKEAIDVPLDYFYSDDYFSDTYKEEYSECETILESLKISSEENEGVEWGKEIRRNQSKSIAPKITKTQTTEIKANSKRKENKTKNKNNIFSCNICKSEFSSRNSLFDHLKETNHQRAN